VGRQGERLGAGKRQYTVESQISSLVKVARNKNWQAKEHSIHTASHFCSNRNKSMWNHSYVLIADVGTLYCVELFPELTACMQDFVHREFVQTPGRAQRKYEPAIGSQRNCRLAAGWGNVSFTCMNSVFQPGTRRDVFLAIQGLLGKSIR